ncbi:unnamed protein product [Pleuronectes platessa]|uniref:Uncharacterized protein n=1 Tax=Pleuronectes platessa TaxID=8262 RepID=A0A9N7YEM1_PLEPL|nr:unnamed protein product [Pleuronectes platessa]
MTTRGKSMKLYTLHALRSVDRSTLLSAKQYKICEASLVLDDFRAAPSHSVKWRETIPIAEGQRSEKDRGRELGRKREADGLQPYMDKALLFPRFVALTPGMMPDAAHMAPQHHQEVQLVQCHS